METIEHKIGDTFCLEDGTKLEIAKSACNCRDCYFFNSKNSHCSRPKNIESCHPLAREDKEFIYFKQVKDNNMEEKRNIQISLEEAREWYNSGNSFKRELALKAYSEDELSINNYSNIIRLLKEEVIYNNIYTIKYDSHLHVQLYYTINKESISALFIKYKGFFINKSVIKSPYEITFNSEEAARCF